MSYPIDQRILDEKAILERTLSQFRLFRTANAWSFIGWQTTSIRNWDFQLTIPIPPYYPDQMPPLYVTAPNVLRRYGGGTINETEGSHDFHTVHRGPHGCVSICHHKGSNWDASHTCLGIFTKGILWVEAYASHLVTGRTIAVILDEWAKNQARH